jgi:hypothetical protein
MTQERPHNDSVADSVNQLESSARTKKTDKNRANYKENNKTLTFAFDCGSLNCGALDCASSD